METVSSDGRTGASMKENGSEASSTGSEYTVMEKERKEKASGLRARGFPGLADFRDLDGIYIDFHF